MMAPYATRCKNFWTLSLDSRRKMLESAPVTVTFSEPGAYVVRVMATDGGLTDHRDVTVTVRR